MTNHLGMKLGKKPVRRDLRTLKLARYLAPALPAPPAAVDYTLGISDWGMMLNDKLGCCTIAAVGHALQSWTRNALGRELTVPDSTVLEYYEKWDGYNPANPATDQGGIELDVLNDWRQQGFDGQSLNAFAAVEFADGDGGNGARANLVETAIWLFGGIYIGLELPLSAQAQDVWDIDAGAASSDSAPGSWGGHAVYVVGYDVPTEDRNSKIDIRNSPANFEFPVSPCGPKPSGDGSNFLLTCVTWGQLKKMTWAWFEKYCSEAYALVSTDWLKTNGVAPSGFDLAALEKDLAAVTA